MITNVFMAKQQATDLIWLQQSVLEKCQIWRGIDVAFEYTVRETPPIVIRLFEGIIMHLGKFFALKFDKILTTN